MILITSVLALVLKVIITRPTTDWLFKPSYLYAII